MSDSEASDASEASAVAPGCIGSGYAFPSRQRDHALARGKDALCPECLAKLRASIRATELKKAGAP